MKSFEWAEVKAISRTLGNDRGDRRVGVELEFMVKVKDMISYGTFGLDKGCGWRGQGNRVGFELEDLVGLKGRNDMISCTLGFGKGCGGKD